MKILKNFLYHFFTCFLSVFATGVSFEGIDKFDNFNREKNIIPIAMALDDGYIYPTIVAITSIVENADFDTKYSFYIMHPGNFSYWNRKKLLDTARKYKNCDINLIDMNNKFSLAYTDDRITTPAYYRLDMAELLPNIKKIIYIDGDVLAFKDLKEMYGLDMCGLYYRGFLDVVTPERMSAKNDHYICDGVMLVNLEKLREDKICKKFKEYMKSNLYLPEHDQTVINNVCYKKIGLLPPKFGVFNMPDEHVKGYHNSIVARDKYSMVELWEAVKNPVLLHCVNKPWSRGIGVCRDYWWECAEKTCCFNEIFNKYGINDGEYMLESSFGNDLVVDVEGGFENEDAEIRLWKKNWTPAQKFKIKYVGRGCYTIQAQCSGKYLSVKRDNNTGVCQCDCNGSDTQKWFIVNSSNGDYYIISKCYNLSLTMSNWSKNGSTLYCEKGKENLNQKFKIVK